MFQTPGKSGPRRKSVGPTRQSESRVLLAEKLSSPCSKEVPLPVAEDTAGGCSYSLLGFGLSGSSVPCRREPGSRVPMACISLDAGGGGGYRSMAPPGDLSQRYSLGPNWHLWIRTAWPFWCQGRPGPPWQCMSTSESTHSSVWGRTRWCWETELG